MPELSSNWKSLSAKIGKKSSKKLSASGSKVTKKASSRKTISTEKKNNKKQTNLLNHIKETDKKENGYDIPHENKTPIEVALWTKENDINSEDLASISVGNILVPEGNESRKKEPGKYLAIDCEFVGVGPEGKESALARVSIVNFYGHTIFDQFVKPREKVTDWRTWVSGVTPKHMNDAMTFEDAQAKTAKLLENRILVGHAVHHDLESLFLSHPKSKLRDTSQYKPFRKISMGRTPSLKKLALHFLKIDIQGGSHSSVEDARATMLLFRLHRKEFEKSLKSVFKN